MSRCDTCKHYEKGKSLMFGLGYIHAKCKIDKLPEKCSDYKHSAWKSFLKKFHLAEFNGGD